MPWVGELHHQPGHVLGAVGAIGFVQNILAAHAGGAAHPVAARSAVDRDAVFFDDRAHFGGRFVHQPAQQGGVAQPLAGYVGHGTKDLLLREAVMRGIGQEAGGDRGRRGLPVEQQDNIGARLACSQGRDLACAAFSDDENVGFDDIGHLFLLVSQLQGYGCRVAGPLLN